MTITPWLFRLDLPAPMLDRMTKLLEPSEHARAAAFRHDLHRNRFIARRAQLRLLLSGMVGASPDMLAFAYGAHGKPRLRDGGNLRFNASSAGPLGLCVVGRGAELGCDIAQNQLVADDLEIASRLFSADEYRTLSSLSGEQRNHAFLAIWTRKEALLKAVGEGLNASLDTFTIHPDKADQVFRDPSGDCWTTMSLEAGATFVAAIAVKGSSRNVEIGRTSFLQPFA